MAKKLQIKNPTARGGLGGLSARLGAKLLGPAIGPGAGTAGAGMALGDEWLQEMGGYQLGIALTDGVPFFGGEDAAGSGGFL